ncbi:unnamed protein product [Notodromas monacha]|uniref:S1 motif domain-containing protein n=1 Tax=Notodromas monacha TaxID=399045 RepID=A0A7R9GGW3_9CRUS|nr:unnamed protein product [Notodromas monacha]CAG0922144.1 unnamed protein product [Notodromas monacha]
MNYTGRGAVIRRFSAGIAAASVTLVKLGKSEPNASYESALELCRTFGVPTNLRPQQSSVMASNSMVDAAPVGFNESALAESLSFHGEQLLISFSETHPDWIRAIECWEGRFNDYKNPGLLYWNPRRKGLLFNFIKNNATWLFQKRDFVLNVNRDAFEARNESGYYAVLPPLERFLKIPESIRRKSVYDLIRAGDMVVGVVTSLLRNEIQVKILALEPPKSRQIHDLDIMGIMSLSEMPPDAGVFNVNTLLRCEVMGMNRANGHIFLGMQGKYAPPSLLHQVALGKIENDDLPESYRKNNEIGVPGKEASYEETLLKSQSFFNPRCVEFLASSFGIDLKSRSSFLTFHSPEISECSKPGNLRKRQKRLAARENVEYGVELIRQGKLDSCEGYFNNALTMDPENVDAYIYRGVMHANSGRYSPAFRDLQQALSMDPKNSTAINYLVSVERFRGEEFYKALDHSAAMKCFETVLFHDPHDEKAREFVEKIKAELVEKPLKLISLSPREFEIQGVDTFTDRQLFEAVDAYRDIAGHSRVSSSIFRLTFRRPVDHLEFVKDLSSSLKMEIVTEICQKTVFFSNGICSNTSVSAGTTSAVNTITETATVAYKRIDPVDFLLKAFPKKGNEKSQKVQRIEELKSKFQDLLDPNDPKADEKFGQFLKLMGEKGKKKSRKRRSSSSSSSSSSSVSSSSSSSSESEEERKKKKKKKKKKVKKGKKVKKTRDSSEERKRKKKKSKKKREEVVEKWVEKPTTKSEESVVKKEEFPDKETRKVETPLSPKKAESSIMDLIRKHEGIQPVKEKKELLKPTSADFEEWEESSPKENPEEFLPKLEKPDLSEPLTAAFAEASSPRPLVNPLEEAHQLLARVSELENRALSISSEIRGVREINGGSRTSDQPKTLSIEKNDMEEREEAPKFISKWKPVKNIVETLPQQKISINFLNSARPPPPPAGKPPDAHNSKALTGTAPRERSQLNPFTIHRDVQKAVTVPDPEAVPGNLDPGPATAVGVIVVDVDDVPGRDPEVPGLDLVREAAATAAIVVVLGVATGAGLRGARRVTRNTDGGDMVSREEEPGIAGGRFTIRIDIFEEDPTDGRKKFSRASETGVIVFEKCFFQDFQVMADAAQIRVQDAVTQMINDLDKLTLRRMQGDMHRCAARCCDDRESHLEAIHRCIENCAIPLNKAQTKVQGEMQQFQNRLQRCVLTCQDKVQDTLRPETTEVEV